jgi:cation transport ATPase
VINILASIIPGLVSKGVEIFDKKFQTEAEKQVAVREYEAMLRSEIQQAWESEQKHITQRHNQDMTSDSTLSKNIRPLALIYLMALYTLAFFMDVPETVLEMLRDLLMTVFVFYFGARTIEKVTGIIKSNGGNNSGN